MREHFWQWQRRRLAKTVASPLREWLQQEVPAANTPARDIDWLVIDCETSGTGYAGSDAQLLSIGWVPVRNARIVLADARHRLLATDAGVGQSATVHRLTDEVIEQGENPEHVMAALLQDLQGKWPVFHGGRLDVAVLGALAAHCYGGDAGSRASFKWSKPWSDTLLMAQRRFRRRDESIAPGALQLGALRQRLNLPAYRQHHALSDAIATAEVFLAQLAGMGEKASFADCWA